MRLTCYSPHAEDFSNKTHVKTVLLQNPTVWLAGYRYLDHMDDQEEREEDEQTIVD